MDGISFLVTLLVTFLIGIATGYHSGKNSGFEEGKAAGIKEAKKEADRKAIEEACNKVPGFKNMDADAQKKNVKSYLDTLNKKPPEADKAATPPPKPPTTPKASAGESHSFAMILLLGIAAFVIWSILHSSCNALIDHLFFTRWNAPPCI